MSSATHKLKGRRDLTEGSLRGNLFVLAAPLMLQMSIQAVYNLTDAFWLGKLSSVSVTAPGVSMPFVFIAFAMAIGFGNGGAALVSQYAGAGQHDQADRAAGQTLLFLLAISSIISVVILLFARPLLTLAQVSPEVAEITVPYLRIFIMGTPLVACAMAYSSALRALGDTMTVLYITAAASLLNVILDPILIFWMDMGVTGAAVASVIAQFAAAVICVVFMRQGRAGLKLGIRDMKPDIPTLWKIITIGLPAGISMSSNSLGFLGFQTMINRLGKYVIAAFTIGFRVTHFLAIPGHAMAMAAAPVVGQALGANKPKLAHRAVRLSVIMVALGMAIPYAVMMWQGRLVARIFVDDPNVMEEAARFFLIVPASNYFFTVIMVLGAAFYGSGHTRPVMIVSLLRQWGLRIPLSFLFGYVIGWGSIGVYVGMGIANILCAVLMLWMFLTGTWAKAVIPTSEEVEAEDRDETEPDIETLDTSE